MIHYIVGTEAEFIKIFPIMLELNKREINYNFISTGQHDLSKSVIIKLFNLKKPDHILYRGQEFTSIIKIFLWFITTIWQSYRRSKEIFNGDKHGIVLVHGDTVSTLLGTIIARLSRMNVGHVEAGLRSGNIFHPFPEELTRRLTSYFTTLHFCPGNWAIDNLGKNRKRIKINTEQNTLLDSLAHVKAHFEEFQLKNIPSKYFVFILHRTEHLINKALMTRLIEILHEKSKGLQAVFVMHHTTESALKQHNLYDRVIANTNIITLPRQSYPAFMTVLWNAEFIVTDGGSNQEECYYMGVPTLILRKATERIEGLGENVVLSKLDFNIIEDFCINYSHYRKPTHTFKVSPSKLICDRITEFAPIR